VAPDWRREMTCRVLVEKCESNIWKGISKMDLNVDVHVSVHHDIIYENDQQDATV